MPGKHLQKIFRIEPGSIAEEMELAPGDIILSINGQEIADAFDYHFLVNDEYLEVLVRTGDGEEILLEIEKDYEEDLGIVFESSLMDDYRSCSNRCIFCFIDQLPKGMRETMYFKDDDSRLSFLQGNYITMTNMDEAAIRRIVRYKLEPINISVHTTEPDLRVKMLGNRFAGKILEQLDILKEGGIVMNGQIVLCRGINDGEHLDRTIHDLSAYLPYMESLSVVPVGLSAHREGLFTLEPFNSEDAARVIDCVEGWQEKLFQKYGLHFVHASDEWYLLAGRPLPEEDRYDGYLQLENGVGMLRLQKTEFENALSDKTGDERERHVSIATGMLAADSLQELCSLLRDKYPRIRVDIHPIRNHFFGESITVSGLLTGGDIISQLQNLDLGGELLLPANVLRSGEDVLLDDVRICEIEESLQIKVRIVKPDGADLLESILGDQADS